MKTIHISQKHDKVLLEHHLSPSQPVALVSGPFLGQREVCVKVAGKGDISAIAWCKSPESAMFSSPRFFTCCSKIPLTELLIFRGQTTYTLLIPLSPHGLATQIRGGGSDTLRIVATNSRLQKGESTPCLVAVEGQNLRQTLNVGFRMALQLTGGMGKTLSEKSGLLPWMQKIGWRSGCFGADVTHDQVLSAVWSMRQTGISPGFVLLDEGWQDVSASQEMSQGGAVLRSFDADPVKFPFGLKGLIEELSRAGVDKVGVWHPILGYRGGIHQMLAGKYGLERMETGQFLPGKNLGETFEFYHDFYAALADMGAAFAVAGDQSSLDQYFSEPDERKRRYLNLHSALQAASGVHFSSPPWNDDCLRGENLYWWTTSNMAQIGTATRSEGWKEIRGMIRDHLYNALWVKELMHPIGSGFSSKGNHQQTLALFCTFFGAPLILSDPPGQHDKKLLEKFLLPGGVLACPTGTVELVSPDLFVDPVAEDRLCLAKAPLGIGTGMGTVFGAFHLSRKRTMLCEKLSFDQNVAIWSARKGFVGTIAEGECLEISLGSRRADLYTAMPIEKGVCILGTATLYLPASTVGEVQVEDEEVSFTMKVTGPVALFCQKDVLEVRRNGKVVPWDFDSKRSLVTIEPDSVVVGMESAYHLIFEG